MIAESYERIHRSNLVGMGIIPFQYLPGETSETLGLSGRETITVDLPQNLQPGQIVIAQVCLQPSFGHDSYSGKCELTH